MRARLARCASALNPYRAGRPRWVLALGHALAVAAAIGAGFAFMLAIFAAGSAGGPGGL